MNTRVVILKKILKPLKKALNPHLVCSNKCKNSSSTYRASLFLPRQVLYKLG